MLWHHFAITFSPYMLTRVEQVTVVLTLLLILLLTVAGFYRLLFLNTHMQNAATAAYVELSSRAEQLLSLVQQQLDNQN